MFVRSGLGTMGIGALERCSGDGMMRNCAPLGMRRGTRAAAAMMRLVVVAAEFRGGSGGGGGEGVAAVAMTSDALGCVAGRNECPRNGEDGDGIAVTMEDVGTGTAAAAEAEAARGVRGGEASFSRSVDDEGDVLASATTRGMGIGIADDGIADDDGCVVLAVCAAESGIVVSFAVGIVKVVVGVVFTVGGVGVVVTIAAFMVHAVLTAAAEAEAAASISPFASSASCFLRSRYFRIRIALLILYLARISSELATRCCLRALASAFIRRFASGVIAATRRWYAVCALLL